MTQTIINEGQAGTFKPINALHKFRAWLACDNDLFDRTCPQCRGMYSSMKTANCPKCGAQLTFLTDAKGNPISISEGTFYLALSQKQKEADLKRTMAVKGGVERVRRFKLYSFPENGAISPPKAHHFCKKGALVEITVVNHESILSLFQTGDGVTKVQELFHVFENYGDSVNLIQGPKVNQTLVSYNVNADGTPAPLEDLNAPAPQIPQTYVAAPTAQTTQQANPLQTMMEQFQAMQAKQMQDFQNKLAATMGGQVHLATTPPAQPAQTTTTVPTQPDAVVTTGAAEVNPFANAS